MTEQEARQEAQERGTEVGCGGTFVLVAWMLLVGFVLGYLFAGWVIFGALTEVLR
jgi:hypothetical protein